MLRNRLYILLPVMLIIALHCPAQTILAPGDIAFAGYITSDDNNLTQDDEISFILLKDIDAGTTVFLTDFGWTNQGRFQTVDPCGPSTGSYGDGIIQWTASTVLYCGTQVNIQCKRSLSASTGTVTPVQSTFSAANNYISLNQNGDQVFLFQGSIGTPSLICGLSINRNWDGSLDSCEFTAVKSLRPAVLNSAGPAIFPNAVNAAYNCSVTTGDTLTLQTALTQAANWNKDTTTLLPVSTAFQLPLGCTFSGCALPFPVITQQPAPVVICENNNAVFNVAATGATAYQWQQLVNSVWTNCTNTPPFSGTQSTTLTITAAPNSLNGVSFRCVVTGAAPPQAISNSALLTVQAAPNITAQTPARAICEGQNCAFSVTTGGAGLTYQWQFDNGSGWTNLTNTPPYTGANTSSIQIAGSPFSIHLTNYRCIVNGTCAPPDTSTPVFIFVNQLPNVTSNPVSDSICAGQNTVFSITATGATLQYIWQMNTGTGFNDLTNTPPFFGVTTQTLNLTATPASLNGARFRCIVSGVCAPRDTSAEAILTVGTIPGTLTVAAGDLTPCEGSVVSYVLNPPDPTATYTWQYPGNDVTFTDSLNTAIFTFGEQAESGSISVQYSNFCGVSPVNVFPVNVQNGDFIRDTIRICPGDSAFINGNWQTLAGDYAQNFTNSSGCDSSFITTLEFNPEYLFNLQVGICPGDSAFLAGAWQQAAGFYNDTLPTENGCDSILITELVLFPLYNENVQVFLCPGDSVFAGGAWQTNAGIYTDSLFSLFGCDSIVTSTVINALTDSTYENKSICQGDSIFAGGAWQTLPGLYSDLFSNAAGCDSTHYVQLTVNALPSASLSLPDSAICITAVPYPLTGGSPAGGSWSGAGVNGAVFDPGVLGYGTYTITYTITDSTGCSGSATDQIAYFDCTGLADAEAGLVTIFPNPARDYIEIRRVNTTRTDVIYEVIDAQGRTVFSERSSGVVYRIDISRWAEGVYQLRIRHDGRWSSRKFIKQ